MRKVFLIRAFCFILCLVSCDKYDRVSVVNLDEAVLGSWSRTDVIPSGRSEADIRYFDMVFTYTFNADASYSNKIDFYGFKDENPNEIIGQSETTGMFEVRGDSIFIAGRENTSWEKSFNPEPTTVQYEENEGYGSRFEIVDNALTLYYISYPADAPVFTQMSFDRVD